MKRIHLFEFEDYEWFPNTLRICMTRYIVAIHKMLGTTPELKGIVAKALKHSTKPQILDMCSGSGGPMPEVVEELRKEEGNKDLKLTLSDLYPNLSAAKKINAKADPKFNYLTEPVDATDVGEGHEGVRTMVCSMHHMPPKVAKKILKSAKEDRQPICVFELSDNSIPKFLWWLAIPINIIMVLFITPFVRPMSWQQIVFTYLIPILPLVIAWDGAVSNIRTYTLDDMDELLEGLESDDYEWEKSTIKGKGGNRVYLLGLPK
ncbi:MAG: hypothetical protein GY810_06870 [Aureispira sp.]|nr:hypothetical protein [Aureispira sp.]